ncbi:MAG: hypothetical protein J6Q51_03630 [Clostridia bacterium]|nr:hypothetical protein [Clostridia bacterium]
MVCENCKEKVATSYCQIKIDGKVVQKYLCQQCRAVLVRDNEISVNPEFKIKNQFCRNCGTTLKDFVASSCVGCENCYTEFAQILEQALKSVQIKQTHEGKIPSRFAKKQEIKNLEELLNRAMQNSDLLQVNRLSARLRQLKGGNNDR